MFIEERKKKSFFFGFFGDSDPSLVIGMQE